jgi:hypothetical protein
MRVYNRPKSEIIQAARCLTCGHTFGEHEVGTLACPEDGTWSETEPCSADEAFERIIEAAEQPFRDAGGSSGPRHEDVVMALTRVRDMARTGRRFLPR